MPNEGNMKLVQFYILGFIFCTFPVVVTAK